MIAFRVRPRGALHVVLFEPEFFRRVHGDFVVHAGVADDGFEASIVRGDPVGHVAPVGAAGSGHFCTVNEGIFFEREIQAIHDVHVGFSAPVVGDFVGEFLAVTRGPAAIDHESDVARAGKDFCVPAVTPGVGPHGLRAAVKQHEKRVFFRGIKFGRANQHGLDLCAFGAVKPKRFGRIHFERGENRIVVVRDLPGAEPLGGRNKNLRRHR